MLIFIILTMAEAIQFGEITAVKVHDEPKSAEFTFNAVSGSGTLGFKVLKPTRDNDEAYEAMVSLAILGLQVGGGIPGGQHVHVRYDQTGSEANELDEISIHT